MPYPLAKLAYGLRCRLTELTTPLERYNLQTAAGDPSICPSKLQIVYHSFSIKLYCDNGTVSTWTIKDGKFYDVAYKVDDVLVCPKLADLHCLNTEGLKSDHFGHFLSNNLCLTLSDCMLSQPFFEKLKMTFPNVTDLSVLQDRNVSNYMNFTDLLTVYPDVQTISTNSLITKNWMVEILQVRKHSLKALSLSYLGPEQCEVFDFYQLLEFIRAQRSGFSLSLLCYTHAEKLKLFFSELTKFLDLKLVQEDNRQRTRVHVYDWTTRKTWHLPFDDDNKTV